MEGVVKTLPLERYTDVDQDAGQPRARRRRQDKSRHRNGTYGPYMALLRLVLTNQIGLKKQKGRRINASLPIVYSTLDSRR